MCWIVLCWLCFQHYTLNAIRFLSMLEEEIYGENSPIWEADFTMPASDGTQLGHQTGKAVCAASWVISCEKF